MIPIRQFLRHGYLSSAGKLRAISPGVHILNGHIIANTRTHAVEKFRNLLKNLSSYADFINIETACQLILERKQVERPAIAFTFDDGFDDCYLEIAPVLEEFHVNAAFFINPNFTCGNDTYIHNFLKDKAAHLAFRKPMSVAMIQELHERGFIIGAHGMDHENLCSDNPDFLDRQIKDCKERVENIIASECNYFAWPFGKYTDISNLALDMVNRLFQYNFSSDEYSSYMSRNVFNRRHFECDWPASHLHYFLSVKRQHDIVQT